LVDKIKEYSQPFTNHSANKVKQFQRSPPKHFKETPIDSLNGHSRVGPEVDQSLLQI
jgi:hypothetical protein